VRALEKIRFHVLSEALIDGEVVFPSAMLTRLSKERRIIEARAYLTDEQMLKKVGPVPEEPAGVA